MTRETSYTQRLLRKKIKRLRRDIATLKRDKERLENGYYAICGFTNEQMERWPDWVRHIAAKSMGREPIPAFTFIQNPGKADWIYDHEFGIHMPACSRLKWHGSVLGKCHQGPLVGQEIATGSCTDTDSHAAQDRALLGEITP